MAVPAATEGRSGIQVLARAIDIVRLLEAHPSGLRQREISDQLGLTRSTTSRILAALETEGFVSTRGARGRYQLGPEFVRIAASARRQASFDLHPLLVAMSAEIQETVDISIISGDQAMFVDQVVASNRLRAVSAVGEYFPLHASANGKALLAQLPEADRRRILGKRLDRYTPHTLTTPSELRAELTLIAQRGGVAFDREEHSLGICAVGAVAGTLAGDLLAVSIPVPATRFEGRERELTEAVVAFAARIADALAD